MLYSPFGNTGLSVSRLSMGGHEYRWSFTGHLKDARFTTVNPARESLIAHAIEQGVNYFDTTFFEEVQSLGQVLSRLKMRRKVTVNGMIIDVVGRAGRMHASEVERFVIDELDTRLSLLKDDHFDFFSLNAIDQGYQPGLVTDILYYYEKQRERGKFRFTGITCHDWALAHEFLGTTDAPVRMLMIPCNFASVNNPDEKNKTLPGLIKLARDRGIAITAMKSLCWFAYGVPFTCFSDLHEDVQASIQNCIAWQTALKDVDTTVVGCESVEEFDTCLTGVGRSCDKSSLRTILDNKDRLDLVIDNASRHSPEIGERIYAYVKQRTGQDFGRGNLEAFKRYWRETKAKE